ncbi:MAG: hypothetical protein VKN33_04505 [Candidatus Sericytochromatia bacterium]|nr:hypothetical protein [Candidatus Sericytochromatia bacterium]
MTVLNEVMSRREETKSDDGRRVIYFSFGAVEESLADLPQVPTPQKPVQ